MLKLWDLSSKFAKTNVRFESSTFEIEYMQNFVKIRKLILFGPKYPKNTSGIQISKTKAGRKFQIFPVLKCWIVSVCLTIFLVTLAGFGSLRLVSARFGSFRVLVSTENFYMDYRLSLLWIEKFETLLQTSWRKFYPWRVCKMRKASK